MSDEFPEVRYTDIDGVAIAYEVRGDGPIDLLVVPGTLTSLLASAVDPTLRAHYEQLASFARVIRFDRRGTGLSDPLVAGGAPALEQQVADVIAVMDRIGSERAALYGHANGGQVAVLFASMHPERVQALVLRSAWARFFRAADYPYGPDPELQESLAIVTRERWGDLDHPWGLESIAPSRLDESGFAKVLARVEQVSATKAAAAAPVGFGSDVRDALTLVQAPTLVLCAKDSETLGHSQYLAEHIPNARLATVPGADTYLGVHSPELAAAIEEFLTGTRPVPLNDRVLATVLFTDIVESTERLAAHGDQHWRAQLDRHDHMVRAQLDRFRGREINTTGDGFFATFDGPARAVQCAQAIVDGAHALGIAVRAGVHTGECERRGEDLAGIAVHIGARVASLAQAGEVLVTATVRDLVAGSGITFTERGKRQLKGVPGQWTILAVGS